MNSFRRTPPLLFAVAVLAAVALWPASAHADDRVILVVHIEVITERGEQLSPELSQRVLDAMETKVGGAYIRDKVTLDLKRIYNLRQFRTVRLITRLTGPLRISLSVHVQKRPPVAAVRFRGRKSIDADVLIAELRLRKDRIFSQSDLHYDVQKIEDIYKKNGYPFVQVRADGDPAMLMQGVIRYEIEEGPHVSVEKIAFRGNQSFTDSKLRGQMIYTKESWLFSSGSYDPENFEQDLDRLNVFYRAEGHLNARVELESLTYSANKGELTITIHVEEGEPYRIGRVSFDGNAYFADEELRERLGLKEGGFFKGNLFQEDQRLIRELYGDQAMIEMMFGQAEPLLFHEDDPVVDVHYQIVEGSQIYVGRITIEGNRYTKDSVIRNALSLHPGQKYSYTEQRRSEERLRQTRHFTKVTFETKQRVEKTRVVNDVTVKVFEKDLTIQVEESDTNGSLNFGGALSSDSGILGFVSITRENFDLTDWPKGWKDILDGHAFLGAGQRLNLTLAPGSRSKTFSIDFRDPYFQDSNYAFGSNLSFFERDRDEYSESRGGIDQTLRKNLDRDLSVGFGLRLIRVDIDRLELGAPPDVVSEKGSSTIGAARLSLIKDTRRFQNRLLPYDGLTAGVEAELASVLFGSSFNFVKISPSVTHYSTLKTDRFGLKHILKSSLSYSVAQEIGDDVPFYERFYAGGRSFRGFEFRGVGPHQLGEPVGAQSALLGTFEYNFPLIGDMLRGVTFVDYGALDADPFTFGDPRASFGFGVRFFAPQLPIPISIDLAAPFLEGDDDQTQAITFSLGGSFN